VYGRGRRYGNFFNCIKNLFVPLYIVNSSAVFPKAIINGKMIQLNGLLQRLVASFDYIDKIRERVHVPERSSVLMREQP
jgi:hypothetical protein